MGIKQLYNDNLRKLPNEYGDVSVMTCAQCFSLSDSLEPVIKLFNVQYIHDIIVHLSHNLSYLSGYKLHALIRYSNDPNFLDRQVWANSVDPDL